MSELDSEEQALLRLVRAGDGPSALDEERIRRKLYSKLGITLVTSTAARAATKEKADLVALLSAL